MMTRRFLRQHQLHQETSAFLLLETVVAAATALVALAIIAPMFARQIDLARRSRDTNLADVIVNQDINAIRQYTRYMRLRSGPYSTKILNSNVTGLAAGYSQSLGSSHYETLAFECRTKDKLLVVALDDLKQYVFANMEITNYPQVMGYPRDITPPNSYLANRYKIERTLENVSSSDAPALRLSYKLTPQNNSPELAFERTAEIQLEMQNGC